MFIFLLALNCLIWGGGGCKRDLSGPTVRFSDIFLYILVGKALNQNRHMLYSVQYVIQNFLSKLREIIEISFKSYSWVVSSYSRPQESNQNVYTGSAIIYGMQWELWNEQNISNPFSVDWRLKQKRTEKLFNNMLHALN